MNPWILWCFFRMSCARLYARVSVTSNEAIGAKNEFYMIILCGRIKLYVIMTL